MCCSVYSKAAWILLLLAGYGQEYLPIPIVDIPDWTCHRRKKREREGEGKNAWSSLHLVKRRFRDRENIADDGHCKIR